MSKYLVALTCLFLVACQPEPAGETAQPAAPEPASKAEPEPAAAADPLAAALDAQTEEAKARYRYRHPRETLEFFGVRPGMTVVEGLPGGGWYSKILLPYLGSEGRLIGADYSVDMWSLFPFGTDEFLAERKAWLENFPGEAREWAGDDGASAAAFACGNMPSEFAGTADVVLMIRALHNLARFSGEERNYIGEALADAYAALKPGGILGVVQHHARDEMSDEFADGSHGYLKKSYVIAAAERAGFQLVDESDVNANPKDQPSADDIVWRLPPTYGTSAENPELRAELEAIGESNRMTLKFRKPE
jgi:predicted methyltransferase